jgi:formylglycine-generating enzyme required for sulfatase activity
MLERCWVIEPEKRVQRAEELLEMMNASPLNEVVTKQDPPVLPRRHVMPLPEMQIQDAETCLKARYTADGYLEEKDYEKAAKQYEKILKLNPKDGYAKKQYNLCIAQQSREPAASFDDDSIEMVRVKGGAFTMGCTSEQGNDCYNDEKPAHQVTLSDFYIGKYEVTQAQWKSVMGTNIRQQRDKADTSRPLCGEGNSYPMYYVSWNEAQEFIRKLNAQTGKNYRLPTEAEWEYAARGGAQSRGTKYSGSNTVGDVAWYIGNSGNATHPVGQKSPNGLGLYDMSGNVWEWCSDWYGTYSSGSQTNPAGPSSGSGRVLRGGSWRGDALYARVPRRSHTAPAFRYNILGFRLASGSK